MASEIKERIELEIVHVLFIDLVGYSKLRTNEQRELVDKLNQVVRSSNEFRKAEAADRLIKIPTGDGMALVFYKSPEQPVECALEISKELQKPPGSKEKPQLRLRMGVHSGPISAVTDVNERTNAAGVGMNIAQRVMDCGDAGHILLSKRVAEDLEQYGDWQACLHDLGEVEVKHGARVHVFNLYNEEVGNPEVPERLRNTKPKDQEASDASARREEGFWVAVLPFKYAGANTDLCALAEGLSEDIVTGLSRFSYLRVIARSSTLGLAKDSGDVRAVGKELGAHYVMEGSLRQAGSKLRLAVQLVDTISGAHLWAENYERTFSPEAVFEIQDDLVPRIVSTVADVYGVLPYSMSDVVRSKAADQLTPYEALLRAFGYGFRINPQEHAAAREWLERAVQQSPAYADAWAMLSILYANEYGFEFGGQPDPLGRALQAARRATDAAPSNAFAQSALAKTLFFRKEFPAFRSAAEQAMSLNPVDGAMLADLGAVLAYSGEWERGCVLVERAIQLNPRHPPWYWLPLSYNAYRKGDYQGSVNAALKVNLPGFFATHEVLAAAYGQLGERDAARQSLGEMLKLVPDFGKIARGLKSKWFVPEMVEHVLDGLQKAGLEIEGKNQTLPATGAKSSGKIFSQEAFWVAVLPFKYGGSNSDLTALAEGITGEIVTGLSRFSYLKVIARGSTSRYPNESVDVRSAGKELGARYVMEGSLRQAGTKLRLAVQLVDTISGAHLWAENYERTFSPEAVFEFQDELVPRIVSTVADQYGALVHSMSESLRGRSAGQYSAHEAVLRAFGYHERMTPEEHAEVRDILEAAVAIAPDHSDCLAELASIYWHEYAFGYNILPDPIGRARAAAQRAVASAPTSHFAHCALATSLFFQKDYLAFRAAAERALALNRMDSSTAAILGNMIAYSGDWEYGLGITERAMQLNPHHAGWYRYVAFCDAYRKRDYRGALASALKVNMPAYHWPHVYLAAVYGQLGEPERATAALQQVYALLPNFGAIAREEFRKWLDPELTEHLLDGLRKAGLEIAGEDQSPAISAGAPRSQEAFWIAVLPFKSSGGVEMESFADGLGEDITTGLSRFSYLSVVAKAAAARLKGRAEDERTLGAELGARYVVQGSIRTAGPSIRVTAQLVDTRSGTQLWAETYNRDLQASTIFDAQDDIVARIVATVADGYGVLVHSIREATQQKDEADFSSAEWQFQFFAYREQISPASHGALKNRLERAAKSDNQPSDYWACLAQVLVDEYSFGFGADATSLDRALAAARRAIEIDRANQFAMTALAQTHFFRKDLAAFRPAAERAMALNPLNTDALGILGLQIVHTGEFERGTAIVRRAMELNPNHAGWMHFAPLWNHFHLGEYEQALACANRVDVPGHFWPFLVMASACGHLGRKAEAEAAVRDLLALDPEFAAHVRYNVGTWHFASGLMEPILEGLRKAGLEISPK